MSKWIPQTDTQARGAARRSRFALIVVAGVLTVAALTTTGCSQGATSSSQTVAPAESQSAPSSSVATDNSAATPAAPAAPAAPEAKLQIKDTHVGKGAAVKTGDSVTVDYTGWLMDGTKFDSSIGREPFTFQLGGGQVIEGWDKGVVGMKVGGTRVLIIPPSMGYGAQGYPPTIPANAPLKFEIKLLSVQPGQ